jgi:hypothetical protein
VTGGGAVAHEEAAAAPGAPAGESAPEFPPQRGAETAAPAWVPAQRPDAGVADAGVVDGDAPDAGAPAVAVAVAAVRRASPAPGLGARERAVLDFERRRWKHVGAKEQAIRDGFGISPTHYYQLLNALLDDPAALAHSPAVVNRLRRARDARRLERSGNG